MTSSPITSWQIEGKKVEAMTDFIFSGSKITADADSGHEIQRLFGRKTMTNLDSILKTRDITLLTKACIVKAVVFPVVMNGYEINYTSLFSWNPKSQQMMIVAMKLKDTCSLDEKL